MRRSLCLVPALLVVVVVACGSETTPEPGGGAGLDASTTDTGVPDVLKVDDGGAEAGDATTCTPPATPPRIVFLNKAGGTYEPGSGDARVNTTPLVSSMTTALAWAVADGTWQQLKSCVAQKFEPFNVTVTDVDPGAAVEHLEVVFAQAALSVFNGAPAISELTCSVVPNGISFVSQTYAEANVSNGCAAAAANVGFTLGLEPVVACPDALAFPQTTCPTAAFTDAALQCGTNAAATCQCAAGLTQNSFARLLAVTGPRCL